MSAPDTSEEAVEAMAEMLASAAYVSPPRDASDYMRPLNCGTMLDTAAMLRALLRERDEARTALATARADALREAAEAARCVPIPEDCSAQEAHGRISAALEGAMRILSLIPAQEAQHDR